MVAVLYIIASFSFGAGLILTIMPYIKFRLEPLTGNRKPVTEAFIFMPASYLTGTLILSWITYFLAVMFKNNENPLFLANLFTFLIVIVSVSTMLFINRVKLKKWLRELKKYGFKFSLTSSEWFIFLLSSAFWSFFIFRSLYMDGNIIRAGISAFSDFGAHLPVIRNFSLGQNFPAQYPHYPDGTMRYHFMFYFHAANLEYLGLNLAWALNLPSILSLVSFSMLLYSLCVGITGNKAAGVFAYLLFVFRSSFAFFTYLTGFDNFSDFLFAVKNNLNADGSPREHIGNTLRESWGLWAQKVYVNQRHLAFAMGLFILALFLLLPLFMNTIKDLRQSALNKAVKNTGKSALNKAAKNTGKSASHITTKYSGKSALSGKQKTPASWVKTAATSQFNKAKGIRYHITEIFVKKDSWVPESLFPCICAGLLLGLTAFWNGAVVIAAISVFFVMAALSKHKLENLVMAVITFLLSTFQSWIFVGSGTGSVSIKYKPGFLTETDNILIILKYYTELLGILPFILAGLFIVSISRKSKLTGYVLSIIPTASLIFLLPTLGIVQSILIVLACLALLVYLIYFNRSDFLFISPLYIPVFVAPIVLATTLKLTPDITVNHKYIILSVILLNIPVADMLARLFGSYKKTAVAISLCVVLLLTLTGIVDIITLYNLDKNSVSYNETEPVKIWVQKNTNRDDIFLTHYMTHYGAPMSVMLAGRSLYSGYPYFTVTAGYDAGSRENVMKRIYSAVNRDELRDLAISENIDYIVIEEQNRTAAEYNLNEQIFHDTFPVVFIDAEKNIIVFKVQ
ncbi:MAG: hypothetical protein GX045_09965 [Clostridiaceae bacterium]|nr:hypothetical protein [Clostridiaceae bacterium]